ncbi:MAG: hypothetical protein AAGH89_02355, partial [Verrucomicrobiota bacterium]
MKSFPVSFFFVTLTLVSGFSQESPDAFTLNPEQQAEVAKTIAEDPGILPRVIAESLSVSEGAVVAALPSDMRITIDASRFEEVWDALGIWEK